MFPGGSIIGAHYYLEIRNLLQTKSDDEITRQDYIDLVRRIEEEFLAGVQRNIRTRVLAEWRTSLKMIFVPDYSRTTRAGELYESELYARVTDGNGGSPRWLNELLIFPKGEDSGEVSAQRSQLAALQQSSVSSILNATTLNTGHNWQFTATWMGEPPGTIDTIDANYRMRRMYYDDAPADNRKVRLGHAVAASAVCGNFRTDSPKPTCTNGRFRNMRGTANRALSSRSCAWSTEECTTIRELPRC